MKIDYKCSWCNDDHEINYRSYVENIKRNGRYICSKEGSYIGGKLSKLDRRIQHVVVDNIEKKICTRCNELLLLADFGVHSRSSDSLESICNSCKSKKNKQDYLNKEQA